MVVRAIERTILDAIPPFDSQPANSFLEKLRKVDFSNIHKLRTGHVDGIYLPVGHVEHGDRMNALVPIMLPG